MYRAMKSITSAVIGSLATHLAQVARLPFLKPLGECFKKSFRGISKPCKLHWIELGIGVVL
jgi:hypothetical protein